MTTVLAADEATALRLAVELDGAAPEQVVAWALDAFDDRICVASSMQDAVLVHLVSAFRPYVPVVFLDTGYHFAETVGTRDAVAARYPIQLVNATPRQSVQQQDDEYGQALHSRDPDLCCALRKVEPLERALAPYAAWMTGIRRDDAPTRDGVPVVQWDAKRSMVKVNPLAAWTLDDLVAYAADNDVPINPLFHDGYLSIGCAPCTRSVAPGEDPRAGRWAGFGKTECGLHT